MQPVNESSSETIDFSPSGMADSARMNRLASARRIVNLCLFAWLAAGAFKVLEAPIASLFILSALVAAIIGVVRLTNALETSNFSQTLFVIAMLLPVVNLFAMGLLSMRATKALRAAGFTVGLFHSTKTHVA